jgi:hypothetical protein
MKHLKSVLPIFISFYLITSCSPNAEESDEKVEVYTEEPTPSEIVAEGDSIVSLDSLGADAASQEEDSKVLQEETPVDDKSESTFTDHSIQEMVNTKQADATSINRNVGVKLSKETDFDLMSNAAEEVAIVKKEKCVGEDCGDKIQLQNYNPEKTIAAVVMIKWKEDSNKKKELREYKLKPSALIDIGCSQSCDGNDERYAWKVVSAKYN